MRVKDGLIRARNHFLPNPASNICSKRKSVFWQGIESVFGIDRIHRLQGGLANQMFQYAYAWALQERHPARVRVDLCGYANVQKDMRYQIEEVFEMPDKFPTLSNFCARAAKAVTRLSGRDWSFESTVEYKPEFMECDLRGFVQGYFPSFKYSAHVEAKLRRNFIFRQPGPPGALKALSQIEKTHSVAVHVRRGDYLLPQYSGSFGGICTRDYYRASIAHIRSCVPDAKLFIFSNDPAWCHEEFASEDAVIVEGNDGDLAWADMMLMSRCKHAIIANSSFSLWSRWLGGMGGGICIGPDRFTNGAFGMRIDDILPSSFVRINSSGIVTWPGA